MEKAWVVKEDKKHFGKLAFINFRNAVWHQSFLKILACLTPLSKIGSAIKCWDDLVHIFYPIILILSADYEEHNIPDTLAGAKALCAWAQESTTLEAREQIFSSESLCDVDNSFDTMEHTDVYQALHMTNSALMTKAFSVITTHNVFNQDQDPEAYLLLCCICSYMEFKIYASLEVHTEDTINNGRKALAKLIELMYSWNFLKKHLSMHLFNDIEVKGVT
ncbi:uncharacterized protein EDB91DRAFT_1086868 [Suillus paluster]|uniref:uncharacterized protein n=1 Tax=Suillus paluster TaxID=48578 RepID=UPI001B860F22|nr:uncharacterized protein EDB91DRAFT_1086868 [Suillus paluster]KAG1726199.1 hypothetical protein EDB91DRAFT_1086868 [Suillus paluster]